MAFSCDRGKKRSYIECWAMGVLFFLPSLVLTSTFTVTSQSQKREETMKQKAADEKQVLKLRGYAEIDFQSAMAKLTEGALR